MPEDLLSDQLQHPGPKRMLALDGGGVRGILNAKFKSAALHEALKDHFGEITLSDEALISGLAILAKRWDSDSPWIFHDIGGTEAGYYEKYTCGYPVRTVVRASTVAPGYFRPERLEYKPGEEGACVARGELDKAKGEIEQVASEHPATDQMNSISKGLRGISDRLSSTPDIQPLLDLLQ